MKTTRGERAKFDVGDHYVLDWRRNIVVLTLGLALERVRGSDEGSACGMRH